MLAAVTVLVCRPWSWLPAPGPVPYDTGFTLVNLVHLQDAAVGAASWRSGPLGYPLPDMVTATDWLLGPAVVALPLRWLGLDPLHAHDIVVMLGLFATAWVGHRLARALVGPGPHTAIAGLAAGLGPMQLAHAHHINLVHHEWSLLALALGGWALLEDRWQPAVFAGLAWAVSFHFGLYVGMHTTLAMVPLLVVGLVRRSSPHTWLALVAPAVAVGLTVAPVAWVYSAVAEAQDVATADWILARGSWDLGQVLLPLPTAPLHALVAAGPMDPNPSNPGYVVLILGIVGIVTLRGRWRRGWGAVVAVTSITGVIALGPSLVLFGWDTGVPLPYAAVAWLPGVEGLRNPARILVITFAGLGLFAAVGAQWAVGRLGRWGGMGAAVLVGLVVAEVPGNSRGMAPFPPVPEWYDAVTAEQVPGPVCDEALVGPVKCQCRGAIAIRGALEHRRPVVGGVYARDLAALVALSAEAARFPRSDAVKLLRRIGVRVVLEHPPVTNAPPSGSRCETFGDGDDLHRLCVLPATSR